MLFNLNQEKTSDKLTGRSQKFASTIVAIILLLMLALLSTQSIAHDHHAHDNNGQTKLNLNLALKQQTGEYHAPYVAVWVENEQRKSVRTLLLWRKEPKWLKDIRKWWRSVGRKDPLLVDAITSATKSAGSYPLSFKALDDEGKALPNGNYTLYVEVVREKGGRAIIKKPFSLDGSMQGYTLKATGETDEITFNVKPH